MKKKMTARPSSSRTNRKTRVNTKYATNKVKTFYTRFYLLGFAVLAVGAGLFGYQTGDQPLVLGTSILAENGATENGSAQEMRPEPQPNHEINPPPPAVSPEENEEVKDKEALVDCTGPDGRHFQTELQKCAVLNQKSNRPNFKYTDLKPQMTPGTKPPVKMQWMQRHNATDSGSAQRKGEPGSTNMPPITAKNAVEHVLQTGTVTSVENKASSAAGIPGSTPNTTLTQINNQAVYKINGLANKKVLGIFPAAFAKTVYVSADNGNVVKTDQTFLSKLLEIVSF
jgi:hypothetical protein